MYMIKTNLKEMKVVLLLALVCVVRTRTLNQRADDVGSNLENVEKIWVGDMILTKEQAKALYGEEPESSDQTPNQRADESGLNLEDGEQIWEGDMILTKEQAKALYGEEPESSHQNHLVERHDPSDDFESERREGDMRLSKSQIQALYGQVQERLAPDEGRTLWPDGIVPYKIDQRAETLEDNIREAIRKWEEVTCIQFKEHTGDWDSGYHVFFYTPPTGNCSSDLGMNETGIHRQDIQLAPHCNHVGVIMHEIGHAIGFLHEQNRMDRDNYIRVVKENVPPMYLDDVFKTYKSLHTFHEIPYDYGSLMHYEMAAASINGKNSIIPHKPEYTLEIGQIDHLSFSDVKLANLMYKCSAKCNKEPICRHEGFVDKNCKCYCPKEYDGPNCENKTRLPEPACGGKYFGSTDIETPNFPFPPPDGTKCIWEFKAPTGKNVSVTFQHFSLSERYSTGGCNDDVVHIRGGGYNGEHTYCGDELAGRTVNIGPHPNGTFVIYKSGDFRNVYDVRQRGFNASVTFV